MKYSLLLALVSIGALTYSDHTVKAVHLNVRDDDNDETENVQVENIYGIPNEKEKLQMKSKKLAKEKKKLLISKKKEYVDQFSLFSKTLKRSDFDRALEMKSELLEKNLAGQEEVDKIKVTTNTLYKKQFMFPEVSKNDYSTELFEELEIAEKNLNANYSHPDNFSNFIKVAEAVKEKLKGKYGDQWTDPVDGAPATPNNDDDE